MLLPLQSLCLLSKKTGNFFFSNALFLESGNVLELFPTNRFGFDDFFFLEEGEKYKSHHLV